MIRLGDVVELKAGFPFKSSEFSDDGSGIRLLRGDNIGQGKLRWSGVKRIDSSRNGEFSQVELSIGDIVLAMDRPWIAAGLKYAVIRDGDVPSLLVQRVARLRAASDLLDQRFLAAVIAGVDFTNYVVGVQTGSAVPHISGGQICDFRFHLPDVRDQEAIAEVLGALDDKIAANRRVLDVTDDLLGVQAAKLQRTGDLVRLGDVLRLNYGKSLPTARREHGDVAVVGSGGIVGTHNESLVDGPTVVVGRKGSVGATYWIDGPSYPIDTTYWVDPFGIPLLLAYYVIRSIDFESMNTDSAVPGLNRDRAYDTLVFCPGENEAAAFDDWARAHFDHMAAVRRENRSLERTRDELLPLLMDGRITVKDAERVAAAVARPDNGIAPPAPRSTGSTVVPGAVRKAMT